MELGRPSPSPLLLLLILFVLSTASDERMYGGIHDSASSTSSPEVEDLARFALQDHNHKENAKLEFVRVVRAREQVVSGIMHYLTVEAIDAGKKKLFGAKIWVKPWMRFKEVKEFKHVSSADLAANQGD